MIFYVIISWNNNRNNNKYLWLSRLFVYHSDDLFILLFISNQIIISIYAMEKYFKITCLYIL